MKKYNIKLIGQPDFYNNIKKDYIDINKDFWKYIFDYKRSSKLINFNKLSSSEKEPLKYILLNLELSYKLLKLIKYKNIGVEKLLFSFNIIENYLKVLEKFTGGIIIKFFSYFIVNDSVYLNIERTIFYKFIKEKYSFFFINIKNKDIIFLYLEQSDQIIQIYIINYILKKEYNKDINIILSLDGLVWFENKEYIGKKLLERFNNIGLESIEKHGGGQIIFGAKYIKAKLFNNSCYWNKCSFCNIGLGNKGVTIDKNKRIDNIIKYIRDNNISFFGIRDPSISIKNLHYFCNKILEKNIKIKIHLFTRFTDKFTLEDCKIFGKAGVRFIGIGLETASTRLNSLINKYDKDYNINDFSKLIGICEKTGIKLHYYTIFGLPTEIKEEIDETYNFLKNNLEKYSFFSYTAGIFGLNKGTDIYKNPKKYGISFKEKSIGGEVFIENYKENNFEKNYEYIKEKVKNLKKILFISNVNSRIDSMNFWSFIEHSNIFHIQKMKYDRNPYFKFFSKNKIVNNNNILKLKYKKNKFIQYIKKDDKVFIKNWVLLIEKETSLDIIRFFKNYENNLSLEDNIIKILGEKDIVKYGKNIYNLIKDYFLIYDFNL